MKRFLSALLVSLLVSSTSYAAPSHCDQLVAYGYPQSATSLDTTQLCRIAYTVNHDNTRKTPIYSAELLLKENSSGDNPRVNAFKADPDLHPTQRAELRDYSKAYDRGHMTPFEDAKKDSAAALQTFYLSNMVPQDLHLNRGLWHALENHVRTWAANSKNGVYVITGPVYDTKTPKTIGNGVAVPDRVFKVVIDKTTHQGIGFLVPNVARLSTLLQL
jgi:endonuclease G